MKRKKLSKPRKQNIKTPFISEENKEKIKDKIIRNRNRRRKKKKERNLRKIKKENERIIKDKIIRDVRTLSEQEEDYYKPKRVSSFWNNNYIEYENCGDKNNNL